VIVYVYNSEQFLQKCLETIINQTLKEIEILCIDDGSTDNSLDILKKYSKRDNRITIIKKKHMNSGLTYNIGLEMAKGNYLSFINSNAYLESNMLEKLYLKIMKYNCDIIICNSQINDIDTGKSLENKKYNLRLDLIPKKKYFSVNEISDNIFQIFEGLVDDKLFRKDFIINNNIKFENINNFNDIQFTFTALCLANSISVKKKKNYIKIDLKNQSNTKWKDSNSFLYIFDKISLKLLQNKLYNQIKESFRKWAINLITINFCLDEISKVYLFNTIQKKFNELDYIDKSTSFLNEYKYWSYIKYQKDLPTINIAYIVNNKNFHLCLVSITSILKNSENENINIIILYKDISLNNIHKIYELKEIRFFLFIYWLINFLI
jgi:glycosyltransferase involved in cell wall biosynthesis